MILKDSSPIGGPVVCAVGKNYIICVPTNKDVLLKAEVGDKTYYCHSNGIRVSSAKVQKITVPAYVLDKEKRYKLIYEVVNKRLPYSCDKQSPVINEFFFRPVEKETDINFYHLSDVHGCGKAAIKTGSFFGRDLDFLILNGDISSSSDSEKDLMLTYEIAYEITKGEIPCVISRGNHDLRGKYAERLQDYMPTDNGKSYYTVRLGPVWMLVLDCGEDKLDTHQEYSGTVAFHPFRELERGFISKVASDPVNEYAEDGVKYRFVLCHIPFCHDDDSECKGERPFNIENEIYTDWCRMIKENIQPHLSIFGHVHQVKTFPPESEYDSKGLGGDMILGGRPVKRTGLPDKIEGTALSIEENGIRIRFTDSNEKILEDKKIIKIF